MRRSNHRGIGGYLLSLLLVSAGGLNVAPVPGQARSPDRPVILLSCPAGDTLYDPLCQAMIQTLAKTVAGPHVISQVARGKASPSRPGDIGIVLHIAERSPSALSGHLEWRQGRDGKLRSGPVARMAVKTATSPQQSYEQFTSGLLKATSSLYVVLGVSP